MMLFRKAFTLTFITQGLIFVIGTINTILIVRVIGAEGRGIYSILLTTVSILSVLSSGGLIWSNTYIIGKERDRIRSILPNSLYQTIFSFFLLFLLLLILPERMIGVVFEGVPERFISLSIVLVLFELGILHLGSILLGLQDFKKYNLLSLGKLILFTLCYLFFLYLFEMKLEGVIYSWIISSAATFIFALLWIVREFHIQEFKWHVQHFLQSIKIGWRALLANILGQLLLRSDLFLINWYLGLKAVGYYSVGVVVAELLLKVPGIAGNVLFPMVASSSEGNVPLVTRITRLIGIPLFLGAFLLIAGGQTLVVLAFGKEFIASYVPLIWIVIGMVALSYHLIFDNYFAGRGYPLITLWAPGLALILNIGLNLWLIPRLGITGAAISTCFAYLFLTGVKLVAFRNRNGVSYQEMFIPNRQDIEHLKRISMREGKVIQ